MSKTGQKLKFEELRGKQLQTTSTYSTLLELYTQQLSILSVVRLDNRLANDEFKIIK